MAKSTAKRKANPQAAAGGFVPATAGYQARSHGRSHAARPSASARADRAISPSQETSSQKAKRVIRTVAITLLVLIIAGLLAVALYVMNFATQLGKEFGLANSELSQEEQMAITEILEPNEDILQPFYMMLLGSDRRSWNPSDSGRSDTAIIVRVDPQTYTVSMISIPRDTRVYIPGYWTTKFNAAYAYGGASLAIRTASQMTGISLQHFAEVNFQALIDLVDAIGGIDIYVPADVDDVKAGDTFIPKGWNHIDGEQALMLARTRDWIGSDFTRQAFQRQIIKAIINRVLELPATELTSVVKQAAGSILTDMNIGDLFQLALHFKDAEDITFYSANLPSRTQTIDGISYVVLVDEDVQKMLRLFVAGDDPTDFTPVGWEYIDSQVYMGD
ncbi:MAG: LCP family protein [Eggerthellaceae bacterium]|nr:LCP family protein [Eggerthellaceae bacterium]